MRTQPTHDIRRAIEAVSQSSFKELHSEVELIVVRERLHDAQSSRERCKNAECCASAPPMKSDIFI